MIGEFTKAKGAEKKLVLKSLGVFAGVYILATIVLIAVQVALDFNMKVADGVVALFLAGYMAGGSMVKRVGRMPEKEDRIKLQIGSLMLTIALQLIAAYAVVAAFTMAGDRSVANLLGSLPLVWAVIGLVVMGLLSYALISVSVRSGAKAACRALPGADMQAPDKQ